MSARGRGAREKRHTGSAGSGPAFRRMSAVTDVTRVLGHPAVGGAGAGDAGNGTNRKRGCLVPPPTGSLRGHGGVTRGHGGVTRGSRRGPGGRRRARGPPGNAGSAERTGNRYRERFVPPPTGSRACWTFRASSGAAGDCGSPRTEAETAGGAPVLPEAAPWRVSPAPRSVTDSAAAGRENRRRAARGRG